MAKKRAYQTYYRDKKGELRIQLVDAETGKPVTNTKDYIVLDSTEAQGQELTGNVTEDTNDAGNKPVPSASSTAPKIPEDKRFGGGRGTKSTKGKNTGTVANDFGFIDKPGWTKYAPTVAGLVGGPLLGAAATGVNLGINAKNVSAINQARDYLGLAPMSAKDIAKGIITGTDKKVGDVQVGNQTHGVSFGGGLIDGKGQMTVQEVTNRQQALARDKTKKNSNPQSKLHPELSSTYDSETKSFATTPGARAKVSYNMGPKRPGKPDEGFVDKISAAAAETFGAGTKVSVTSGQHQHGKQFGSNRHNDPTTMDFAVTRPDGTRVKATDPDAMSFAETARTMGIIGTGFGSNYMGGNTFHFDEHVADPGQANQWANVASQPENVKTLESAYAFGETKASRNANATNIPMARPTAMALTQTPNDIESMIRDAAVKRNIDPEVAVAVAKTEGLNNDYQSTVIGPSGIRENSFGPFQLNTDVGLGIDFQKETGLDPKDPSTISAQIDFALDKAAIAGNWNAWHGAVNNGIPSTAGLEGAMALGDFSKPADMMDVTSDFGKYSKNFYSQLEKSKISTPPSAEASPGTARMDSPSSGRPSFGSLSGGANRPASMGNSPSESGSRFGGSGLGSPSKSYGGSYSGAQKSGNSPSEGGSRFGGSGLGSSTSNSLGREGATSGPGLGIGGRSTSPSRSDKDKDRSASPGRSQGPSGGGYGGFGGPR